jgi:hypothetical protein
MAPVPKIAAAGIAGAVTVVLVWLLGLFTSVEVPPEVASAITTIFAFVAGWLMPDRPVGGDAGQADVGFVVSVVALVLLVLIFLRVYGIV